MSRRPYQFSVRDFIVFSRFLPCEQSLLHRGGEKEALLESRQAFEDAATRSFGLVNLVFSCQTGFIRIRASVCL